MAKGGNVRKPIFSEYSGGPLLGRNQASVATYYVAVAYVDRQTVVISTG
jgi:hypothetical protein